MSWRERTVQLLSEGTTIEAKWEAGGDETLVYIDVDGERVPYDHEIGRELGDWIAMTLELPNAGGYFVDGGGSVTIRGGDVIIAHESRGTGVWWDYETDERHEIDEELAGTDVLFELQ